MQLGYDAPEIYGDPALLLGQLWGREYFFDAELASDFVVIPHYTDLQNYSHLAECISPLAPLDTVLTRVASSELVISSSLHGLIVAEAFGIPAVLLSARHISLLKFWDYYLGTGRNLPDPARSMEEALRHRTPTTLNWNPDPLLSAFPTDLWKQVPSD
jgi:pyruvyltransferase